MYERPSAGGVPILDGGFLPAWTCLGCRGAAGVVDAFIQSCRASLNLLYYMR